MKKKNIHLIVSILAFVVFIGYLGEAGPHTIFGFEINIWIMRLGWFLVAAINFKNYLNAKEA